ncbi:MAG: hypothetical protein JWP91_2206 [Fibrobacteres bacterium]|nr:hypothetical protein [Fibrobacterota bacterium]
MPADIRSAYLAMRREGQESFPPECLEYLFHLIYRASYQGKGFRDLPAAELCRIFRAQAAADFGVLAGEALARFGLRSYGDMGRAVFLLARNGCLTLREGETIEAYASLGPIRMGKGTETIGEGTDA